MKRLLLVTIFSISLLFGSWLSIPQVQAGGGCLATYVVQPGDTLSSIASKVGVNVWQLAKLNNLKNVDYIYIGQVLCLPASFTPPQVETQSYSSLDLIVQYTFDADDPSGDPDAKEWTLGRNQIAGKRQSYLLLSGDSIETFSNTTQVRQASLDRAPPIFWLVRTSDSEEASTYILTVIGDPRPLLQMQMEMTPTQSITNIIPAPDPTKLEFGICPNTRQPVEKLSLSGKNEVDLQAELVAQDGSFIPIDIVQIDYHETVEIAATCYESIGFALHSTPDPAGQGYRLLMVLSDDGTIGPPGYGSGGQCSKWYYDSWWNKWRRAWYSCSGYNNSVYYPYYPR